MKKSTIILIVLSVLSLGLMMWNPFNLIGLGQVLYSILPFGYIFYDHFTELGVPGIATKTLHPETKADIDKEKIKSIIRLVLYILGAVIAVTGALNLNIPILNVINVAIQYIADNLDVAAQAIGVIVGLVVTLIGYFRNKERFAARVLK